MKIRRVPGEEEIIRQMETKYVKCKDPEREEWWWRVACEPGLQQGRKSARSSKHPMRRKRERLTGFTFILHIHHEMAKVHVRRAWEGVAENPSRAGGIT